MAVDILEFIKQQRMGGLEQQQADDPFAIFDVEDALRNGATLEAAPRVEPRAGPVGDFMLNLLAYPETALGVVSGAGSFVVGGVAGGAVEVADAFLTAASKGLSFSAVPYGFEDVIKAPPTIKIEGQEKLADVIPPGVSQQIQEGVSEALTHRPINPITSIRERSERQLEMIGTAVEQVRWLGDVFGNKVMNGMIGAGFDRELSALAGASIATFFEASVFLLGPKAPKALRSVASTVRRRISIAQKTGNWSDPKLTGSVQDFMREAKNHEIPGMADNIKRFQEIHLLKRDEGLVPNAGPYRRARQRIRAEQGADEILYGPPDLTAQELIGQMRDLRARGATLPEGARVSRPVPTSNEIVADRLRRRALGIPDEPATRLEIEHTRQMEKVDAAIQEQAALHGEDSPQVRSLRETQAKIAKGLREIREATGEEATRTGARAGGELARDLRKGFDSVEDARAFGEIATLEEVKEMRRLRRETLKAAKDFPPEETGPAGGFSADFNRGLRRSGGQLLKDQADLYLEAIRAATGKPKPGGGPPPPPPQGPPPPPSPTSRLRKGEGSKKLTTGEKNLLRKVGFTNSEIRKLPYQDAIDILEGKKEIPADVLEFKAARTTDGVGTASRTTGLEKVRYYGGIEHSPMIEEALTWVKDKMPRAWAKVKDVQVIEGNVFGEAAGSFRQSTGTLTVIYDPIQGRLKGYINTIVHEIGHLFEDRKILTEGEGTFANDLGQAGIKAFDRSRASETDPLRTPEPIAEAPLEVINPFEAQAKRHGIEYNGPTGETVKVERKVGEKTKLVEVPNQEYFDPDTAERFTVDSAESVKVQLARHRQNHAERTIRYNDVTVEDYDILISAWERGETSFTLDFIFDSLRDLIHEKPKRMFETYADHQDFITYGEAQLSRINEIKRKRGLTQTPVNEVSKGTFPRTAEEAGLRLNDGAITEPSMLGKEPLDAYLKAVEDTKTNLTRDEIETSIAEGVDIGEKLATQEARDAYKTYLDLNEEALRTTEPRGFAQLMADAYEIIPTLDPNKLGMGLGGLKGLTEPQRAAWRRLKANAKNMIGDINELFDILGFTEEQRIKASEILSEIRDIEPQDAVVPENYIVPRGVDIAADPIVKSRKGAKGANMIVLHKSQVDITQGATELHKAPMNRAFETPPRTFEAAGESWKDMTYDRWREADNNATNATSVLRDDVRSMRKPFTTKAAKRIGAFGIAVQEKGRALLKSMDIEIPRLTDQEAAAYRDMRSKFDAAFEATNEMRISIGLEPLERVPDYMTFMRTFNWMEKRGLKTNMALDPPDVINKRYFKNRSVPFRFGLARGFGKRGGAVGAYPVELDAFRIFETYMEAQIRHLNISPVVALVHELVETKLPDPRTGKFTWEMKHQKPNLYRSMSAWNNFISGKPAFQLPRLAEQGLRMLQNNLAISILGANYRTFMIQFSALKNTYIEVGLKRTIEGIAASFEDISGTSKNRKFALDNSHVLSGRQFDIAMDDALRLLRSSEIGEGFSKIGRATLKPLQISDMETAIASWTAAHRHALKDLNLKGDRARSFADDVVTRTQASARPGDLAPIQRSVLGRAATLFQTFVINDFNFIAKDILGLKNPRISNKATREKVVRFVLSTTALSALLEEVLGLQSPYPTPVRDYMEGKEAGDSVWEIAKNVAFGFTDPIPIAGSGRYGNTLGGAGVGTADEFISSLRGAPLAPALWEPAGKILGVPGVAQVSKSVRARKRGESLYGQLAGRFVKDRPKFTGIKSTRSGSVTPVIKSTR